MAVTDAARAARLLDAGPSDVHVVASGDPLLHGVGGTLIRLFGPERVAVLPHVSAVTLACARLGWTVQDTEVISLVTAEPHTAVRRGGQAVVLSRDRTTPAALARLLTDTGRGDSEFDRARTARRPCRTPPRRHRAGLGRRPPGDVDDLNVVAVRYLPDERSRHLPDDAFAHDGQITKQTIRAVTLAALAPRPGELLWDVGAGSGSISVEWCRSGPGCTRGGVRTRRATRRTDRLQRRRVRRQRRGARRRAGGVRRRAAAVGDLRRRRPDPARTARRLPRPPARPAAGWSPTPSPLNRKPFSRNAYSRLGGELRRFQHYRGEPLGEFTGWRPAMPVTQWAGDQAVTVYFIGAGPGAADLITVRGQRLLRTLPGVPLRGLDHARRPAGALCPPDARVVDTGPLTLDQIVAELADADAAGHDVARLHSGDPSLYSALAEQCRRLDALGIDYEIVPGVPAFAAAAAALGRELTVPGVAQTVTLTRVATLSTAMPPGEDLETLVARRGHPGAAPGRRPDRHDRPAAAGRRLHARNTLCGSGFRELAAGDGAARHARRHRRPDARRRHHQTAVIVVGDCAGRRGIHGQLPVFGRTSQRAGH